MTYEDVKNIRKSPTHSITDGGSDYKELSRMIDDAIEKQIPKKITHEATLLKCVTCPTCKNVIDEFINFGYPSQKIRVEVAYCKYCGQAIDWSEEE